EVRRIARSASRLGRERISPFTDRRFRSDRLRPSLGKKQRAEPMVDVVLVSRLEAIELDAVDTRRHRLLYDPNAHMRGRAAEAVITAMLVPSTSKTRTNKFLYLFSIPVTPTVA